MTGTDFEDRLRHAADRFAYPTDAPPGLVQTVRRRRARRAAIAAVATGATVAVIIAVPVALSQHAPGTNAAKSQPADSGRPTAPAPTPTDTPPTFPALPAPPTPADNGTPGSFYASVGAGHERLAIVSTATGVVQRYLQAIGSQALFTYSWDRRLAWQWHDHGCGNTWTQIDLASGAQTPAFTDLPHPREVAISPTGQRIAYVYYGAQKMVPVTTATGTTLQPAGCPSAQLTLAVTDTSTGATRSWSLPSNDGHALYPAFDATATHVAFVDSQQRVRVLDLNRDASIAEARPLTDARPDCQQSKPTYRPGSNQLLVEQECHASAAIVGYDADNGTLAYSHHMAAPGLIAAYATDRSGKHLLYSFDPGDNSGNGVVYIADDNGGADRKVTSNIFDLDW